MMNKQQRYGVFLSIVALVVGLFLHNPFEGYKTMQEIGVRKGFYERGEYLYYSFQDWKSVGAKVKWLKETSDFISYSIYVLFIGGTWVFLFRSKNEKEKVK